MGEGEDLDIGSIAVAQGFVTPEALRDCREDLRIMGERGVKMGLAEVFMSKGLVSRDDIAKLEKMRMALTGEGRKLGPFELLAQIGEGGMGTVYKVRDTRTDEIAALKVLPASLAQNAEFVARFEREAQILKSLAHPNVVKALDFGKLDYGQRSLHYISMEFIEGETLMDRIRRDGAVEEALALDWLADIVRALQRAHHGGLIHRDVKPDNIFLSEDRYAKLGDFGLAVDVALEATRITRAGMFMGSVHYASPEQAQSLKDIDIRSDIYSLGATFYHALTGQVPFEGDSAPSVLVMHLSEELPWPGDVNPQVSDAASELIAKMMAKKKEERFQDPMDLLHALDEMHSEGDVRPFLRSSALSSIARSRDGRERVLKLTRRRKERTRRRIERRPRVHPYVYVAAGVVGFLVFVILLVAIFGGGEKEAGDDAVRPRVGVGPGDEKPPEPEVEPAPAPPGPGPAALPEVRIPPGAWVLHRETFEGASEWRYPADSGSGKAPAPTALEGASGRVLGLAALSDNAYFALGAVRKVQLTAHRNAVISFRHRTEGQVPQLVLQLSVGSPGREAASFFARFKPSSQWKLEAAPLEGLRPMGAERLAKDPVEIREMRFFAGVPGVRGGCYLDDVVVYEPEEPGFEPVLDERLAASWKTKGAVSVRGEEAALAGGSETRLARSLVDFKVSFLARRLSHEGKGDWWASVLLGGGLCAVLRSDGDVHVTKDEELLAALGAGTVKPQGARLEFALRGERMTVRTPAGQYRQVRLGSFEPRGLGFRSGPGAKAAFSRVRVKELDPFERYGRAVRQDRKSLYVSAAGETYAIPRDFGGRSWSDYRRSLERGEPERALAACVAAAALGKGPRAQVICAVGETLLLGLRRPQEALVALDTCLAMGPSEAVLVRARYHKARALEGLGRSEEAMDLLEDVLRAPAADEETKRSARTRLGRLLPAEPPPVDGVRFLTERERPKQKPIVDFAGRSGVLLGDVRGDDLEWKTYASSVRRGRAAFIRIESGRGPLFIARKDCVFAVAVWTRGLNALRVELYGPGGEGKLSGYLPRPGSRWKILAFDSAALSGRKPLSVERVDFVGEVKPGQNGEVRVARVWASTPAPKDPTLARMAVGMAKLNPLLRKRDYDLAKVMVEDMEREDRALRKHLGRVKTALDLASGLYKRARINCAAKAKGRIMTFGGFTGEVTDADFSGLTVTGRALGARRIDISRMTPREIVGLFGLDKLDRKLDQEEREKAAAARTAFFACEGELDLAQREVGKAGKMGRRLRELLGMLGSLR